MSRLDAMLVTPQHASRQRSWAEWLAWIATEDHCEWANQYVAWFKTPLGVLVIGAICSLLCGLLVAPQGFVLLASIAAIIAVGLVWPVVTVRGVRCRLVFTERRGREGKASTAKLIVTNRWPWPVWGLAVNDPLLGPEETAAIALARVPGWSTATFNCRSTPVQRGVYPKREVRLGTGFPFGLYQASRVTSVPRRLVVWPQTFSLPPLGTTATRPLSRGSLTESRVGSEGTRLGVRDHRIGDSLRDVHWAKTARYDRLIVSERESTANEEVAVLVPTEPSSAAADGGDPVLEWRLRIAASIAESFVANHGQVSLWLGGVKHLAGQSPGDLQRLFDELARFNPSSKAGNDSRPIAQPSGCEVLSVEEEASRIVLRRLRSMSPTRGRTSQQTRWIEVDAAGDVPAQIQRGWRRGSRRACRAG